MLVLDNFFLNPYAVRFIIFNYRAKKVGAAGYFSKNHDPMTLTGNNVHQTVTFRECNGVYIDSFVLSEYHKWQFCWLTLPSFLLKTCCALAINQLIYDVQNLRNVKYWECHNSANSSDISGREYIVNGAQAWPVFSLIKPISCAIGWLWWPWWTHKARKVNITFRMSTVVVNSNYF